MSALRSPLLWFALPALAIRSVPAAEGWLELRPAAIAHGEWWRLWTCHWVHYSPSHLAWNLAILLVAGWRLESFRPGLLRLHIGLAVPLISVALLAMEPTMVAYGGLSGLASGVIALLGLELIRTRHDMPLGAVVLSLLGLKITTDLMLAKPLFVRIDADSIHTSSIAHLAGIAGALVHSGWRAVNGKIFVPCNSTPPLSTHR